MRFERPPGFDFLPVQFCGLELATDEGPIEYSMSLASSPTRPWLEFGARVASGSLWKRAFAALRPGDVAEVDGAFGRFVLDEARDAVMVAGGIGITPLKGMLEYATDKRLPFDLRLVYGNRDESEIAYREELDALAAQNESLRIVHTLTRGSASWPGRRGRVDAALLAEAAKGLDGPVFYVCGAPSFVHDLVTALLASGVPMERVRYERFHGYEASRP